MTDSKAILENDGELPLTGHDQSLPDTDPPPAEHHGFLEQFTLFGHSAFEELKAVALQGLQSTERVMLLKVGLKLFTLGAEHVKEEDFDEESKAEIEQLILKLDSILWIQFLT